MVDRPVRHREGANIRIVRITTLPGKHGRYALAPELFDCGQDAPLIVDYNITLGGIAPLDVIEGFFLMNVNQYASRHRIGETGALNFVRLKDDVTVRQDDGGTKADQAFQYFESGREQTICERIIDEEGRHGKQLDVTRMLAPIPLQRTEVVAIAELGEKVFQDAPVAVASDAAIRTLEMIFQVLLNPVVVEQRVVDVDQENDRVRGVIDNSESSRRWASGNRRLPREFMSARACRTLEARLLDEDAS